MTALSTMYTGHRTASSIGLLNTFLALLVGVDFLQFDPLQLRLHFFFERILPQPNNGRLVLHAHAIILHVLVHDVVREFAAEEGG